ncbi:I78 family peptidase inhibitor [Oceaniglobus trochenteri]|uniref:I78 family peptidase inhibitor n=1 Tax=Oceaniglobus trochenteri TaxID=2763260 RepID=UPI001CFF67C7|nr:I78 family peptidase inhibitor [Oceaniglobus trochenteri]
MQPKTYAASAIALALMAGCVPTEDGRDLPTETAACDIAQGQDWIGQNIAEVPVPTDMNVRILRPNSAATTDYLPTRLNILVDRQDIVQRVTCG